MTNVREVFDNLTEEQKSLVTPMVCKLEEENILDAKLLILLVLENINTVTVLKQRVYNLEQEIKNGNINK